MSNPEVQAKAQALMAKLEGQERIVIDEIQRFHVRKQAREAYACCVACFDKAGTTGPSETLERCVQNCQVPYQQASQILQQEVSTYKNRLGRSMQDCQDKVRDMLDPGDENNARKMRKVEDAWLSCTAKSVEEHIALLKPLKDRMAKQLGGGK